MTAFGSYINGTDPDNHVETYHIMQGLNRDGSPLANGTTFMFPGDPVTATGDIDGNPGDKRMMGIFGPIEEFNPGDSQFVMIMLSVGQGADRLASIVDLRNNVNNILPQGFHLAPVAYVDVDTLYAYTANAIYPVPATLYAGNFSNATAEEIVTAGDITINGDIVPTSTEVVLPPFPGFEGTVVKCDFDMRDLVRDFVPFYGITEGEFTFEYTVPGASPSPVPSVTGRVTLKGHLSGDLNLDGEINILDVIYFVKYRFHNGLPPRITVLADVNQDQVLDLIDIIYLVDFLFRDGAAPLHP